MLIKFLFNIRLRIQIWYYKRLFRRLYWANLKYKPDAYPEEAAKEGFLYMTGMRYKEWFNNTHKAIGSSRKILSGLEFYREQMQSESKT